jgi:WD40 repeat protein
MEKEFKNRKSHNGNITNLRKISDTEFMTCSDDQSFKVWDNDLQGCSYTYETHQPIYHMRITGEKNDILIASLGEGDFLVLGLQMRNQNDIIKDAHDARIVQVVTLDKLKNKYFATRCTDGDLSIWSANPHPDKVFTIDNIDVDENHSHVQDTIRESHIEEEPPKN